jgi:Mg2+ and Co2+ transporter CorA
MGRSEGRPMTNFIPSENLAHFRNSLESGADAFTRSMLLKRLLREAEKPRVTRQQLDTIDRHIAELRQLIYRQVQLVEKDKLKSHDAERVQNLLAMLNDLMADYQTLRRRINVAAE